MSTARHRAIRRLLSEEDVSTQAHLIELLAEDRMLVTQATVSRDLKAIGAVRQRGADGSMRYRVAAEAPGNGATGDLDRALDEYVLRITPTGALVVVVTLPGAAHVVGRAIDEAGINGVAGTIAGDDTVLVVAGPGIEGEEVADRLDTGGRSV